MKILSSKDSMDSAMKLRDAIEAILGLQPKTILVSRDAGACAGHDVIMRYGCSYGDLSHEPRWGNKSFSAMCIDKFKTSEEFKSLVKTPEFIRTSFPTKYPVLIRETLTGSQSAGVHVVRNPAEFMLNWSKEYYWTQYFEHNAEIRVNAVFLESGVKFRIYKKEPLDTTTVKGVDEFIPGEGGADNCKWTLRDNTAYPKVLAILNSIAPKVRQLGGIFAGIDMIYSTELKNYVMLEINSGPWLTLSTAKWLANIFVNNTANGNYW